MSLRNYRVALKAEARADLAATQATEKVHADWTNASDELRARAILALRHAKAMVKRRHRARIILQSRNGQRAVAKAHCAVVPHLKYGI